MKKILLLLVLFVSFAFSAINECKTDIYFGNGILTDKKDAISNTDLLEKSIKKEIYRNNENIMYKHIGKVDYAYNHTWDRSHDMLEAYLQLDREAPDFFDKLRGFWGRFFSGYAIDKIDDEIVAAKVDEALVRMIHEQDLSLQIKKYESSIDHGHRILIVAHSQGALFANEAYERIGEYSKNSWRQNYIESVFVAPASSYELIKENKSPSFTFDNDPISKLAHHFGFEITPNPNRYKKPIINTWNERSYVYDKNEIFHAFRYYMGLGVPISDYDGSRIVQTTVGRNAILRSIETQLKTLQEKPSQWKVEEKVDSYTFGEKCKLIRCESKKKFLSHIFDPDTMNQVIGRALVYVFRDDGKVYPASGAYVKATCGGTSISNKPADGICYRLEGTGEEIEGKDGPARGAIRKSIYPVSTTVSWDKASDVHMSVSMSKSPGGPPAPGDVYKMKAKGDIDGESQITAECLENGNDPIHIYAHVRTPDDWGISQYEITNPSQLDLGTYGIVVVKGKGKRKTTIIHKSSGGVGGGGGRPDRNYDKCDDEKKKETCGCIPCEYIVYGMQKTSQYGPIAGGDVTIISAEDNDKPNPPILYHTTTTSSRDTLKTGIIEIGNETLDSIEDDAYYIIRVEGGVDVDSDDDFVYDSIPTKNSGTIHAVIRGSDLKEMPFVVNVLDEAIYQVSGDLLGEHYDVDSLPKRLDDAARRLTGTKLDITSEDKEINYRDILLWTPAADKYTLYKPYDIYVQPIVEKTYQNKARSEESYELIYGDYNSTVALLAPLSVEVQAGLPEQTPIAAITVLNGKSYDHIEIDGEYAAYFEIDNDGLLRIVDTEKIIDGGYYDLRMRAVDTAGAKGSWAGLLIKAKGNIEGDLASMPMLQSLETFAIRENSPPGTLAAKVRFSGNGDALQYSLSGANSTAFAIDDHGNISVVSGAGIDYEKRRSYAVQVTATTDSNVSSAPVEITIPVLNEVDTPVLPVQITKQLDENIPIGTIWATVDVLGQGISPIESFKILNHGVPFEIDQEGKIHTTEIIDYENQTSYTFMVIATTSNGNSNKTKCTVVVNNIEPELDKITIKNAIFTVDENTSLGNPVGSFDIQSIGDNPREVILSGKDAYAFRADATGTLYLSDKIPLDYESKQIYRFGVKVRGERVYSNKAEIVLKVSNIPDTPPAIKGFTTTYAENHKYPAGSVVGAVKVLDYGEGNTTSFRLEGEDSALFRIDENGTVHFAMDTQFDYESKHYYGFDVVASSTMGESKTAKIEIYIEDTVDTPPIIEERHFRVEENATKGTVVGAVSIPLIYLENESISYEIARDELGLLDIDDNGTLRLSQEGILDYEQNQTYTFDVVAANTYGKSQPTTLTIDVLDTGVVPTLHPTTLRVPFDNAIAAGLHIGEIAIDDGDSPILSIGLEGDGSEYFDISVLGEITLNQEINIADKNAFALKARGVNKFGTGESIDINITFEPKPENDAGEDMAVYANNTFALTGKVDERYRDSIKEIRWSSPDTDKIHCIDANSSVCEIAEGLLAGEYEAVFTVVYQNGWQQSDNMMVGVTVDPLDNVLSVIEKPLKGLKQMKLSKDRTRIYAVGDFEGDDILKVVDVSDPNDIKIVSSYSYGSGLAGSTLSLNPEETKIAIVASAHLIVADISDLTQISTISSRYNHWRQEAYGAKWYKGNQIIVNNYNRDSYRTDAVIVDADTMEVNQTIPLLESGWLGSIEAVPEKSLLVYQDKSIMKVYDIGRAKIVYEGNNTYQYMQIDEDATHIAYKGRRPIYKPEWNAYIQENYIGMLDISNTDHITDRDLGKSILDNSWYGDQPYYLGDQVLRLFSSATGAYAITKDLHMEDTGKSFLENILPIKGTVQTILADKEKKLVYAYAPDGLKAISTKKQDTASNFVYRFTDYYGAIGAEENYLYLSSSIYRTSNIYSPVRVGTFDIEKSCYPDCGYENHSKLGISYAKIIGNQMHIVSSGDPIDHWVLDTSDKNQTIPLRLPPRYDYAWDLGNEFATTKDVKYIYTVYTNRTQSKIEQGISIFDTGANRQKNAILAEGDFAFGRFSIDEDNNFLYALYAKDIYIVDIHDRMNVTIASQTNKGETSDYVLSQKHDMVYALTDKSIIMYENKYKGALSNIGSLALSPSMLPDWGKMFSLSPNEEKLLVRTKYGLRIYPLQESGMINTGGFKDIYYPKAYVYFSKITWIDNETFLTGGYIVKLKE